MLSERWLGNIGVPNGNEASQADIIIFQQDVR